MKTIMCEVCGQPFEVKPYRAAIAKYCSMTCRNKAFLGKIPANKGRVTNQVVLTCEYCGKEFIRIGSRLKHGRGKHCSPECQYAAIKERPKKVTQFTCLNCNKEFFIINSKIKQHKGIGKYCSRQCRDNHRIGQNHPGFINGDKINWHGPNWYSQRRKTLKRDNYTCQNCGLIEQGSLNQFGQSLAVHHKIPFRKFDGDYKEANHLSNLITLCHSCHRQAETKYQQNE